MYFNHLSLSRSIGSIAFCLMKNKACFRENKYFESWKGKGFEIQKKNLGKTKENNLMFFIFSKS